MLELLMKLKKRWIYRLKAIKRVVLVTLIECLNAKQKEKL